MKVDGGLGFQLADAAANAKRYEDLGCAGVWTAEASRDPFLPLALAAPATTTLELGTGIAVAFARTPMTLAVIGNDMQELSAGRFLFGLGSQIRPHIEKRYSMPWSRPAARMREMVQAMRAIWHSWNTGDKLDFRGEFYTHTLMTPMFSPGANPYGPPRVFVAGVGPKMTQVAGEVADGFLVHPFTTRTFMRDTTIPALEAGRAKAGRTDAPFEVSLPVMVLTGRTDDDIERNAGAARMRLSFYGSTPAYRPALEAHGWGELQTELNRLSKQGDWTTMATLIGDDVLHEFTVVGTPAEVGPKIVERFGGMVDRVSVSTFDADDDVLAEIADGIRSAS